MEINKRFDVREVSNMKLDVVSSVKYPWSEHLKKKGSSDSGTIFELSFILSIIYLGICIESWGRYSLDLIECHVNHSMRPFLFWTWPPSNLFVEGGLAGWDARAAGCYRTEIMDGEMGQCPSLTKQDCLLLTQSFHIFSVDR